MPRKKAKIHRPPLARDLKYNSLLVARFINRIMREGKKDLARRLVYNSLAEAEKKLSQPAEKILETALSNIKPKLEVRSRRVGGSSYQVPTPVRGDRAEALAMRWLINLAKAKSGPMEKNLAQELIAAFNNEGEAIKKRDEVHRMAEANKAFSHFRW